MTTRVYLGGGGTPTQESAVWRLFLRPTRRVICWPFALPRTQHEMAELWLRREVLPYDVPRVELWSDLAGRSADALDPETDVVFVLGGNTFDLLHHLQTRDALALAPEHIARGGIYFGSSAGAVLAGADIDIASFADPNDADVTDTTGLRMLGDAIVRPHYSPDDRDDTWRWTERGFTVLGIPEDSGLAVIDGVARNAGPAPVEVLSGSSFTVLEPGDHLEL